MLYQGGKKLHPKKSCEAGEWPGSQCFTWGKDGAEGNQQCLGETCKKKSSVLHKAARWGSSQLSSLPSVYPLEQISEKSILQFCAAAVLLPWMKLEAERFWPTWVRPLVMGSGHERSCGSFSWKGDIKSQLMMALPRQVPFSPLCPTQKAFSSPHFLLLHSPGC